MNSGPFPFSIRRLTSTSTWPCLRKSRLHLRRRSRSAAWLLSALRATRRTVRGRTLARPACFSVCGDSGLRINGEKNLANDATIAMPAPVVTEVPRLRRVLGRWDLVLLFVVAVFNLNVVPSIAANGGATVWLWIISLALFFWPQGIAVIELAHRFPGEGGVYLLAKEVFGDFHGFLSGWCYWTNNMMYVPSIMLYFVGVFVFVLGTGH